jgi:hypothetical protein
MLISWDFTIKNDTNMVFDHQTWWKNWDATIKDNNKKICYMKP